MRGKATTDAERAKRLGMILKEKREAAGIGPVQLVKESGLNRSYLAYLEQGKFAEVGVDKLSRIIQVLGLSADQVLQEAGYLPPTDWTLPEPKNYLIARYGLPPAAQEQALAFLDFLAKRHGTKKPPARKKK